MPETMIRTKEVRARTGVSRNQICRYRKAGLFCFESIAIRHGGLGTERVYPDAAITALDVLEGLRERGFTLREMHVLFATMILSDAEKGIASWDDKARLVLNPERLEEARRIIEAVIHSYDAGYRIPPQGERPFGKG